MNIKNYFRSIFIFLKMFIGAVMWISGFFALMLDSISYNYICGTSQYNEACRSFLIPYPLIEAALLWTVITAFGLIIFIFGVKEI